MMKGTVHGSLTMGLMSMFMTLLLMVPPTEQQYAWRPQGRFGKRADYKSPDAAAADNILQPGNDLSESLRHLDSLRSTIRMMDISVFETDGVLCLAAGAKGLYRCFSFEQPPDNDATGNH